MKKILTVLFSSSLALLACITAIAQEKQLSFKAGYNVTCLLDGKVIAPNSPILITDKSGLTIISGTILQSSPYVEIDGSQSFYESADNKRIDRLGKFTLSNTPSGEFILNTKKGGILDVNFSIQKKIVYETDSKTIEYTNRKGNSTLMTIVWKPSTSSDTYYKKESLSVYVDNSLIEKYGYSGFEDIQKNTLSGYTMNWTNGKSFKGNIRCFEEEDGSFYHFEEGTYETEDLKETVKESEHVGYYTYTRDEKGNLDAPYAKWTVEFPKSVIIDHGYWNAFAMITSGETGIFEKMTGEIFEGTYTTTVNNKSLSSISFIKGKYTWDSGDVFLGDLSGSWLHGIPLDGKLELAGGLMYPAKWWEAYKLSNQEWAHFDQLDNPSAKFKYASSVEATRTIAQKVDEVNSLINKGKYQEALVILQRYAATAEKTSIAADWKRTTTEVSTYINNSRSVEISNALINKDFAKASKLLSKPQRSSVSGVKTYSGPMNNGTATYEYTLASDGISRIYNGRFEFHAPDMEIIGYYKNNKRDGEWIALKIESEGRATTLYAVYNEGTHNGPYRYSRVSSSYHWYVYENQFSNGKFDGPYKYETESEVLVGQNINGYRTGLWKKTFKTDKSFIILNENKADEHYADFSLSSNPSIYGFNKETGQKYSLKTLVKEYNFLPHMEMLVFENSFPGPENSFNGISPINIYND